MAGHADGDAVAVSGEGRAMSAGIVIVDVSRIGEGRLAEAKTAFGDLAAFVDANEPDAIGYQVHVDEKTAEVTVIQVHPDSTSAERHMTIAGPRFAPFASLLHLERIDVYGEPSDQLLTLLGKKAELLGGAALRVHPTHAGFLRADGGRRDGRA